MVSRRKETGISCKCSSTFAKVQNREYLLHQVTPALERTVTCAGSELSSLFITQQSQCDCGNNFWGSRHTPVPKRSTIVMGNLPAEHARYTVHVCQRVHVWLGKEVSKTNQSWPITRQIAGLFTERCEERLVEKAARLCLKLRWAEVNWQGDGRKGGREEGQREAGWPGPLLADGGKRHLGLPLRMLSSAAIVQWVQHVSPATRNRPPKK